MPTRPKSALPITLIAASVKTQAFTETVMTPAPMKKAFAGVADISMVIHFGGGALGSSSLNSSRAAVTRKSRPTTKRTVDTIQWCERFESALRAPQCRIVPKMTPWSRRVLPCPASQAPAALRCEGVPSSMIVIPISIGSSALPRFSGIRLLHISPTGRG